MFSLNLKTRVHKWTPRFFYMTIKTSLKTIYHHPWFPRLFYRKFDGGIDSGVVGFFLLEHKKSFSIGFLIFRNGTRPSYHSHAFNALSWFISGRVTEEHLDGTAKEFAPSLLPKLTLRSCFHRVVSHGDTWCFTLRGPWHDTWKEFRTQSGFTTLTHGRNIVETLDTLCGVSGEK